MEILNWVASSLNIVGLVMNCWKNKWGFLLMFVGDCILIVLYIVNLNVPLLCMFAVYNALNVIGFVNWTRTEKK